MGNAIRPSINPRRSPRQDRSIVTVEAIFEAALQVLATDGLMRFNTTRVAQRAGVSVGTLYQYFPNKQALLFALLERHLATLAGAIENVCDNHPSATRESIAEAVVAAYLEAQMAQAEVSPALYRVAMELDARELIDAGSRRSADAIERILSTVSSGDADEPRVLAQTLTAALYGTVPAFCHRVLSRADGNEAKKQLTIMFSSYLTAH